MNGGPCESDRSSRESEDSTSDSPEPDSSTPSSARSTTGEEASSTNTGRESESTPMSEAFVKATSYGHDKEFERWEPSEQAATMTPHGGGLPAKTLVSFAADSPAKMSQSPEGDEDSKESDQDSSSSSPESLTLFDLDGFSSRTYPDSSVATAVGTSESCLERWPTSGTAWDGGFSTAVTSECHSADDGCSSSERSLTEILEPPQNVPRKFLLSGRAARGILRRGRRRGRKLPPHLEAALEETAKSDPLPLDEPQGGTGWPE